MQVRNISVYKYYCETCDSTIEISHPKTELPEILCYTCFNIRQQKGLAGKQLLKKMLKKF